MPVSWAGAWNPLASGHVNHKVIDSGKLERGDSCIGHGADHRGHYRRSHELTPGSVSDRVVCLLLSVVHVGAEKKIVQPSTALG